MGKVLVACEFTGTVRDSFTRAGHDAISCDLLPSETPGKHYQGDVRDILDQQFDLIIAHPPCDYLANSGVQWLFDEREEFENRWYDMFDGADFFKMFLNLDCPRVAVENPVMHGYAMDWIEGEPTQYVQPWEYGHGETKKTGLWLKGLPKLKPTNIVTGRETRVHSMAPGPDRKKERSRFFTGIADAMATQWGGLL